MQRVMIVTNSLTGGGAERSMNLVSNELEKRGWPVALVPINAGEPDRIAPTCEVFPLNRQWQGSLFNTLSSIFHFNLLVRSWKPDVIILNCALPELFGALVFRKQIMVAVEHSTLPWGQRARIGRVVRRILLCRGAIWVAVSSHLHIWPNGRAASAVLQNPLTPSATSLLKTGMTSHLERLVFLGRLSPEKRPELMLEIGARCHTALEFIGDGLMRETLENEVNRSSLKVTFKGHVQDPWDLVKSGDLLIVPSAFEGDGLVAIEGMQKNVPLLLSDISDFRRFGLPDRNYCLAVNDFTARINEYRENLNQLVVPKEIANSILASRSLGVVGDTWERFLELIRIERKVVPDLNP